MASRAGSAPWTLKRAAGRDHPVPCPDYQVNLHKCKFCGKCLRFKSLLVDHERMHRESRPYKCSQCSKSFLHKAILIKWAQKTPHQCQYCGKCLSTRIILADHEKLHTGERPYKCHKCTESFIRKPHLFRHLEIHLRELS
uniref:C2H2-type domain-containing protein n=1 Tax=Pseudonaja textilis TaxID=8673 RepID=A0A670ZBV9_PSETE